MASSPVQVVASGLDPRLLKLDADQGESEDVVRGVLTAVLDGTPAALTQKFVEAAYKKASVRSLL